MIVNYIILQGRMYIYMPFKWTFLSENNNWLQPTNYQYQHLNSGFVFTCIITQIHVIGGFHYLQG